MLSLFARRSSVMASRIAPAAMARAPMVGAAFSTRAVEAVDTVEEILKNLHWADLKDNIHELHDLLNEIKTNHAVHKPTPEMEKSIADEMEVIKELTSNPEACRDEAARRIHDLKLNVRNYLYE